MRPLNKPKPSEWENYSKETQVPMVKVNNHLLDRLGEYCSYCEMRLGGGWILHHKLQQASPETVHGDHWPHLLLICYDCRQHMTLKKLEPYQLDDFLWPDVDYCFSLHGNSPLQYNLRKVPHTIVDGGTVKEEKEEEFVFVEVNPNADPTLQRKAANTIKLFQLNSPDYDADKHHITIEHVNHLKVHCHRLQQRTLAWKKAEASIDRIRKMRGLPEFKDNPGLEEMLRQQITHTAHAKGNWSVWMTHFWQELKGEKDYLARTFMEKPEDNPGFHFPGTHHSHMQWEAL